MIPVYNCSQYLPETLESVLQQAPSAEHMQIEVVDDASTDTDVAALVERIGKGRIKYYRQPQNVGSLSNFETCINRSRGELVHLLHGDDKVKPGYYEKIAKLFHTYPEAGAAFCRFDTVNEVGKVLNRIQPERQEDGLLSNWLIRIGEQQRIQYAAISVRREVYEKLGAFYNITYGEDWEMWVRIARHYAVAYTPEVLAEYRRHNTSISGQMFLTARYLQQLTKAMEMVQEHLPADQRKTVIRKSREHYAYYGLIVARRLWKKTNNYASVQVNIKEALRMHQSFGLYKEISWLYMRMYSKLPLLYLRDKLFR
ncbi:glycosyltransferase [Pontibacter sp. 172403-2]|nr:glycosyltransferase [Pontibacter sp. 172403-2]